MNFFDHHRMKNALFLLFALLLVTNTLDAQCDCEEITIPITTIDDCMYQVVEADFPNANCGMGFDITIFDNNNVAIPMDIVDSAFLGIPLIYRLVSSTNMDDTCRGILNIVDLEDPISNYPDRDTVFCSTPRSSIAQPEPEDFLDCSDVTVTLVKIDSTPFDCPPSDSEVMGYYYRDWNVEDEYNNQIIFKDTVCFVKVQFADVDFPDSIAIDTFIACEVADTSLANTGSPLVGGLPVTNNDRCNLWFFYSDTIITKGCEYNYFIKRTWDVIDDCTLEDTVYTQVIEIRDTTAPEIEVPMQFEMTTEPTVCEATVMFPPPTSLSDNCADSADITVTIFVTGQGFADMDNKIRLGLGQYEVIYTATDPCGRSATDTMQLDVVDKTPPIAQGDAAKILQFNAGVSMLSVPAAQFDDGSFDACAPTVYFKVKRMDVPADSTCTSDDNPDFMFDDELKFCCSDIGAPVMVIMRVYDRNPGPGPVTDMQWEEFSADFMIPVTVLDKSAPVFDCLPSDTIDCSEDIFDLSRLGEPVADDNCENVSVTQLDPLYALNECNVGVITRTFVAIDAGGLTDTCRQIVFVENGEPFDGTDTSFIKWPEDITLYSCNADTDTSITGAPEINESVCGNIAYKFEDEVVQYVNGACSKILRVWKVFDWCQFDGSEFNPHMSSAGFWQRTQLIKITDSVAPVLTIPADLTVGSQSSECEPMDIAIPTFSAVDCTPSEDIEFTIKIDIDNDDTDAYDLTRMGNDASGLYPNGTHKIHVFASDGCGNFADDTFLLTVEDQKAPSAIFHGSITAELMAMNGAGMIEVPADLFKTKSSDNCTEEENLRFAFSDDVNDTVRMFNCDNIGENPVNIYVFDEAGNFDFASNIITIQDNMMVCPAATASSNGETASVTGIVKTETGKAVERVKVDMIQGVNTNLVTTNRVGKYTFDKVKMHQDYSVVPGKDINPLNGVTTLDIVGITKHLLGNKLLDSPYKMIAADINGSGSITTLDIVHLRKIILGIIPTFKDDKSWEFIDSKYEFLNPQNPFDEAYPVSYDISDLSASMKIDFVGVKMGDVNNSVVGYRLNGAEIREARNEEVIVLQQDGPSSVLSYPSIDRTSGIQFAIRLPEGAQLQELLFSGLLGKEHVHYDQQTRELRVSWSRSEHREDVPITEELLSFTTSSTDRSKDLNRPQISQSWMTAESYGIAGDVNDLTLKTIDTDQSQLITLLQNKPNPFSTQTVIGFNITDNSEIDFVIYDIKGQIIHRREMEILKGFHEITVGDDIIPQNGIYIYELRTNRAIVRNKMIKVN